MIYVIGHLHDYIGWNHVSISYPESVATGFSETGIEAEILWNGNELRSNGILRRNIESIQCTNEDVLLCVSPIAAGHIQDYPLLSRARKWYYGMSPLDVQTCSQMEHMFVATEARAVQMRCYHLFPGVERHIPANAVELKHPCAMFCGRMSQQPARWGFINDLAKALPDITFYVMSQHLRIGDEYYHGTPYTYTLEEIERKDDAWYCPEKDFMSLARSQIAEGNIEFLGWRYWHDHYRYLIAADVLIDFGAHRHQKDINIKLFDYLRAGKPIVTDSMCDATYLINRYDAGAVVDFLDADEYTREVERRIGSETHHVDALLESESWSRRCQVLETFL